MTRRMWWALCGLSAAVCMTFLGWLALDPTRMPVPVVLVGPASAVLVAVSAVKAQEPRP